jgi:hypothetical protein
MYISTGEGFGQVNGFLNYPQNSQMQFSTGLGKPLCVVPKKVIVKHFLCREGDRLEISGVVGKPVTTDELRSAVEAAAIQAVRWLLKAANALKRSERAKGDNTQIFWEAFGTNPDFVPSWRPAGEKWNRGDIIRTRLLCAAKILAGGAIRYVAWGEKSCRFKKCTQPRNWDVFAYACPGEYLICFGNRFWLDFKEGNNADMASTMLHEALHIYFSTVKDPPDNKGRYGNVDCYERFVLRLNGTSEDKLPDFVQSGCALIPHMGDFSTSAPSRKFTGDGLGQIEKPANKVTNTVVKLRTATDIYASQSKIKELTDSNFWNIFYDLNKVLVVSFWSSSCASCNVVAEAMVNVANRFYKGPHGQVKFYHIRWDKKVNPKIYERFGFKSIPVVFFYYTTTGRPPTRECPLLEGSLPKLVKYSPQEVSKIFAPEEFLVRIRNILQQQKTAPDKAVRDRTQPTHWPSLADGLANGLADDPLNASLAAIKAALDLNPKLGYLPGSAARRQLEAAFAAVPQSAALEVTRQFLNQQGALEKLFRHRLHPITQQAMLRVLLNKAKEFQQQERERLRRMEAERQRQLLALNRRLCANLKQQDSLIDEVCRRTGEASDSCRTLRMEAIQARAQVRAQGVQCPNNPQRDGLQGLAQLQDSEDRQKSLDAIRKALQLNPVGGYLPGSLARRQLTAAFNAVPFTAACELLEELKNGTSFLGRLFRYRLHHLTQQQMLGILARKCSEQKEQLQAAEQRLKQLCVQQQELINRTRTAVKQLESSIERLCQATGEDSDQCQKSRFELLGNKLKLDDTIRSHQIRCP